MMTTVHHVHILHIFGNRFQKDLLHHLPADQAEADWPAASWILLLALLEAKSNICVL